jgi:hypothetical protein
VEEAVADKVLKAYSRMKLKADKRNKKRTTGRTRWQPQLGESVLVKCQPSSDAVHGITSKFQRPYEGPYLINKIINPAIVEIADHEGKVRGIFNLKHLKPYLAGRSE